MIYSQEVTEMCCVKKGPNHGPAPIPQEGLWTQSREIIHAASILICLYLFFTNCQIL